MPLWTEESTLISVWLWTGILNYNYLCNVKKNQTNRNVSKSVFTIPYSIEEKLSSDTTIDTLEIGRVRCSGQIAMCERLVGRTLPLTDVGYPRSIVDTQVWGKRTTPNNRSCCSLNWCSSCMALSIARSECWSQLSGFGMMQTVFFVDLGFRRKGETRN